MRGSIDKHPAMARKKRTNHFVEDLPGSANPNKTSSSVKKGKAFKGIRTKSSVSGIEQATFGANSTAHPLHKTKQSNKQQSQTHLDDSIGAKNDQFEGLQGIKITNKDNLISPIAGAAKKQN